MYSLNIRMQPPNDLEFLLIKGHFARLFKGLDSNKKNMYMFYVVYFFFKKRIHRPLNRSPPSLKIQENNVMNLSHRMIIFVQIPFPQRGVTLSLSHLQLPTRPDVSHSAC